LPRRFWQPPAVLGHRRSGLNDHKFRNLIQRRLTPFDHRHPQRWNWSAIARPLDRSLERGALEPLSGQTRLGLRFFWLHGLFNAGSDSFSLTYIPLFALAYGASNGQVGWLTALANMLGALSLFPGARAVEWSGRRKPVVIWSFGSFGRLTLLGLACLPFLGLNPVLAIGAIVAVNSLRAFLDNFSSPAWTALVADLVPSSLRGRYFSQRNIAMGVASLLGAPLAGWLIHTGNGRWGMPSLGYQAVFFIAFSLGMLSTLSFQRVPEPEPARQRASKHYRGDLRRAIKNSPGFWGLIISAFFWNMALQVAAPFFNVYLVSHLHASVTTVGLLASVTSLTALIGQQLFGRLLAKKGALWVQWSTGLLIPLLPLSWILITAPWQVALINSWGGLLWAGYNLANFNLLLELTPDDQRPRAVALYQMAVFSSAVLGPLLGGYLADAMGFKFIFGLSGLGRLAGIFLFIWLAARPALRAGKGLPAQAVSMA
jgi:MFS family permease